MTATPLSLFDRLRERPDQKSWRQLVDIYTALIRGTPGQFRVPDADAEDLLQEVPGVLVREVPAFEHNGRAGAFRHWLRTVVVHRLRAYWRESKSLPAAGEGEFDARLAELVDDSSDPSRQWDADSLTVHAKLSDLDRFNLALTYAMAARSETGSGTVSSPADRAIDVLRKLKEGGFFKEGYYADLLRNSSEFNSLRARPDFKLLLTGL